MSSTRYESIRAFKENPDDKRHGTPTGYKYGCRCDRCKEAGIADARERKERKRERDFARFREENAADKKRRRAASIAKQKREAAARKDCCTVDMIDRELMGKPNIDNANGCCAICGKPATNKHHIVKRSAGKLVRDGREIKKPTVRLCGEGNASGCHGLAHQGKLHFRWIESVSNMPKGARTSLDVPYYKMRGGHWEYLLSDEPTDKLTALGMEGWRQL